MIVVVGLRRGAARFYREGHVYISIQSIQSFYVLKNAIHNFLFQTQLSATRRPLSAAQTSPRLRIFNSRRVRRRPEHAQSHSRIRRPSLIAAARPPQFDDESTRVSVSPQDLDARGIRPRISAVDRWRRRVDRGAAVRVERHARRRIRPPPPRNRERPQESARRAEGARREPFKRGRAGARVICSVDPRSRAGA